MFNSENEFTASKTPDLNHIHCACSRIQLYMYVCILNICIECCSTRNTRKEYQDILLLNLD
jgi:hypothetical protein